MGVGARGRTCVAAAAGLALGLASAGARAERPAFDGAEPLVFDGEAGHVRIHYVTTTADAVPDDDVDGGGVPDFVEEVAALAELSWDDLVARGFSAPVTDEGLVADDGGDGRFDIYLVDLISADGNFVPESCTEPPGPVHCAGYFTMENDLAGYGYASRTEGISVLTSHELFHAVQAAYLPDTSTAWSEGTATWNEELTFPEQDDFENLVPYFLGRMYRPFDRGVGGGFGDGYVYGAALWPTFLDQRYGDGVVRRTWEACEAIGPGADFLEAAEQVLVEEGTTLTAAWGEFSRWNVFTGVRADPTRYYPDIDPAALGEVTLEPEVAAGGSATISIEGFSARYVPVAGGGEPLQLTVTGDDGVVAALVLEEGAGLADPVELEPDGEALIAPMGADARGVLVVTGISRGGLPRDVEVAIGPPGDGPGDGDGDDEDAGCQAARSGSGRVPGTAALFLAALVLVTRRRAPRSRR